jgi:hypothetical protein
MAPKLSDYVSATEAFVAFEEEFDGVLIPIASSSFEGAGVHDEEFAVSRPATPFDLQSIAPPSNWETFVRGVGELWTEIDLKDVILKSAVAHRLQILSLIGNPGAFAEGAGKAYSNYIEFQFDGYIDLMKELISTLEDLEQCKINVLQLSQAELVKLIKSKDGKASLEQAKADLLRHILTDEKCKVLVGVIDAMISLYEGLLWIIETPLDEIWEEIGHGATIMAELLRRVEIQERIISLSSNAYELGKVYGTIVGVIVWEIIEVVVTGGLGKGLRFIKVAT